MTRVFRFTCLIAFAVGPFAVSHTYAERVVVSLDSGWRFHLGDIQKGETVGFDDSDWREVDLPHDWTIEDLPPLVESAPVLDVTEGTWRFIRGDDPHFSEAAWDDSDWTPVELPAPWEQHSAYKEKEAYGWFRRNVTIPEHLRGQPFKLTVGWVKDADETFLNGVRVGSTGSFPPHFRSAATQDRLYEIDPGLVRGDGADVVSVRAYKRAGYGGGIFRKQRPHERSGPFDTKAPNGQKTGFTIGGIGWYRKSFQLDADATERVRVQFGGVYQDADVWINGQHLGNHPYGYSAFGFDLTPYINRRGKNTLAVRVKNVGDNTRWYSGSGLYRGVRLIKTGPIRVGHWGSHVMTPQASTVVATVRVRHEIYIDSPIEQLVVTTQVLAPDGSLAAEERTELAAGGLSELLSDQALRLAEPELWSIDSPSLYTARTVLECGGQAVDSVEVRFGVRTISFSAERGFHLNGVATLLRGANVHHDNGPLGACAHPDAEGRRMRLLKEAGFNAVRCAHNPPSEALLEACDELGLLVIDESFDIWRHPKNGSRFYHQFFDEWWRRDLEAMVLRDRNHPSIILWSIGNETPRNDSQDVADVANRLAAHVRALDPTRPVTAAVQGVNPKKDPYIDALGVAGYNYAFKWNEGHRYSTNAYLDDHKRRPDRIMYGAESFASKAFDYWMPVVDHPWIIGDFVWTGFDYLGESSIGWNGFGYPVYWPVAYCGDISLTGRRRPQSYYRSALFGNPTLALYVEGPEPLFEAPRGYDWGFKDLRHSWTWPDYEAQSKRLRVVAFSSYDEVELVLNGKSLGKHATTRNEQFRAAFLVRYEPGTLIAYGLRNGERVAKAALRTAGEPAMVRLLPERSELPADGKSLAYIPFEITDASGVVCPNANHSVEFDVHGPATIAGVGSDDPTSLESFQQPHRRAFQGCGLLIVKAGRSPGQIQIRARCDNSLESQVTLDLVDTEDSGVNLGKGL